MLPLTVEPWLTASDYCDAVRAESHTHEFYLGLRSRTTIIDFVGHDGTTVCQFFTTLHAKASQSVPTNHIQIHYYSPPPHTHPILDCHPARM